MARAAAFVVDVELNVRMLVLAEFESGQGRTLEVQRQIEPEDDVMELPCVVVDVGPTGYGDVESWTLIADRLTLRFSQAWTDAFGFDRLDVRLADRSAVEPVRAAMACLIDNQAVPEEFNTTLAS